MYYYVVTGADTKVLGSECKSCRELKFVFKLQALLAVVMFLSTYIHTSTYIFRLLANSDEMGILQKLVLIAPAWLEASKLLLLTGR